MKLTLTYHELHNIILEKLGHDLMFSFKDNATVCVHTGIMNMDVDVTVNEIIGGNSIRLTYQTNPKLMKIFGDMLFKWLNAYPDVIEKVAQWYIIHLDKINELQVILNKASMQGIHFDEYDGMVAEFSLTNKNE